MKDKVAVLGLDIGLKRVGVAGCDGLGIVATELTTVNRTSFKEDVEVFRQLVAEREANLLVVGIPYNQEGEIGFQAKQVMKYANKLAIALDLTIDFVDERYTSIEAEEELKSNKKYSRRNKGLIDKRAATIILQQWLDNR
jgi:putative holliday junction resolvase